MDTTVFQLIIVLFTAHLMGDFLFQNAWLARLKKKSFWALLLHSLVHAALAYLLVGRWVLWLLSMVIFVSHTLIDLVKFRIKQDNLLAFFLDQLSHLAVIVLVVVFYLAPRGIEPLWFEIAPQAAPKAAIFFTALILLTQAGGILMDYFVRPFQAQINLHYRSNKRGLAEGGKTIGWLERMLIFVFVLTGQPAGVGFLIAAKSIFRFGELKDSENRKEAEYIIIGTFASFLFALLVSLLTKWALAI